MSSYQPGIPTGTVNLDVDYQNLKGNFQQLDTTFGVDHIKFSQGTNNGFHTVVHLVNQNADPVASVAAGQIYSKLATIPPGGDSQLFFRTPLGGVEQISGNSALANGYGWFSGILFQWGVIATPTFGNNAVVFPVAFPTNCFNVQLTVERAAANIDAIVIDTGSISTTGFTAISPTAGSANIYWIAIGK